MSKLGPIEFKKLKRISPSQFYSMKNCAYKSLLGEAFDRVPLLPLSPNAYLGTVLHKILELISKGQIKDEKELNVKFDEEVKTIEAKLQREGKESFVSLQMNVRDFGMKKIQLRKQLRATNQTICVNDQTNFRSENWFQSKDGTVGGKVDLVIENGNDIEIIDFKTGAITEGVFDDIGDSYQEVKGEYQEQLKLYAYLYFDSTGKFPTQLSLIDLAKQKFNVSFSVKECREIFEEAKSLLEKTNASIDSGSFSANPKETNCKFCLYRPACSFYLEYLTTEKNFNDVCGLLTDVVKYQNGNVSVFVEQGKDKFSIGGFEKDKFEYFDTNRNKQLHFFNLKRESVEFVYSATRTTRIYEA